jgi:hypothetical protein
MSVERDSASRKKAAAARPRYETPVVMPLGEVARGFGAACLPGSSPHGSGGGACKPGGSANPCAVGAGARGCRSGTVVN